MSKKTFIRRFISSVILTALVAAVVVKFPPFWFACVVAVLIGLGLKEFFHFAEKKGIYTHKISGLAIGLLIPFGPFFRFDTTGQLGSLFIVVLSFWLFLVQFTRRDTSGSIASIAATLFGIIYISYFFSFLAKIRLWENGVALVGWLILVAKSGDIGAYVIGSALGRHKLIPRISPRKSVEGTVGGLVFSVFLAVLLRNMISIGLNEALLLGVIIGTLAQIGDLAESLLKRDSQLKDSDAIFPGLGGSLDIIDSLLFTAPVFYYWLILVK